MILSEKSIVVINSKKRPLRKIRSAIFSNKALFLFFPRMDKNESTQLVINKIIATIVISSIIVFRDMFKIFREVSTIKQIPKRLDEAFRICGDF
jgi:hypothetical protein